MPAPAPDDQPGVDLAQSDRERQQAEARREAAGVGLAVQRLRRRRGWSQARLARVAGVSVTTVRGLEQGDRATRLTVLVGIAAALEVPAGLLFDFGERIRAAERAWRRGRVG